MARSFCFPGVGERSGRGAASIRTWKLNYLYLLKYVMEKLTNYLSRFSYLNTTDIASLAEKCTAETFEPGQLLVKAGDVCQHVFFLEEGIVRSFYYTAAGDENTYCINFPDSFVTAYSSLITQLPTVENMEACTPVRVRMLHKKHIEQLGNENLGWMRFQKEIAEFHYLELERRIHQLQNMPAKDRYHHLLNERPEYLLNIPVQHLSSYLGITPRHLSRIRKEVHYRTNVL